jgi:pimeloyl-ACP methyl ester carboxylesterase
VEAFLNADSQQVAAERRQLGRMPLIILTRGKRSSDIPPDQAETAWQLLKGMHEELAKLSLAGSNRVVQGADHYIQLDRPEAVADAVDEVVTAARRG